MKNTTNSQRSLSAESDDDIIVATTNLAPKKQRPDPKTYGAIEGVKIFTTWANNTELYASAVHGHLQAGIYGNRTEGVFSVTLSDKYKDDEDKGDFIIYTGVGGKEKGKCGGPQTSDQTWGNSANAAFLTSLSRGNSVRVIRSSKCRSRYAPPEGFRYDGLYKVVDCRTDEGENGMKVCHSTLERLPDQLPIPVRIR